MILEINVTAPDRPIDMFFFLFDLKITERKRKRSVLKIVSLYMKKMKKTNISTVFEI